MERGSVIDGRYALDREIARGGMGAIWLAMDRRFERYVAVKILAKEYLDDQAARLRFEREVQAVGRLRSHHIVEVYDHGLFEGVPFMVMELLEGESLSDRLRRTPRFTPAQAADLVVQLCRGLRVAHDAGLVHRDLKPSNVFLSRRDDVETAKVLDFGIAKPMGRLTEADPTTTGMIVGTTQYMSPEQIRNSQTVDHRADLWSVAVVAFRTLSGVNPFMGSSIPDSIARICFADLPRLSEHVEALPPALDGFFTKAFARDPAARHQSARELSAAFSAACGQSATSGEPMSHLGPAPTGRLAVSSSAPRTAATPRSSTVAGVVEVDVPAQRSQRRMLTVGVLTFSIASLLTIGGFVIAGSDEPVTPAAIDSGATPFSDSEASPVETSAPKADEPSEDAPDPDASASSPSASAPPPGEASPPPTGEVSPPPPVRPPPVRASPDRAPPDRAPPPSQPTSRPPDW